LTKTILAIRVVAPTGKNVVSIQPSFHENDPFGREWPKEEDTGMVTLQPGQTTQWKMRLELVLADAVGSFAAVSRAAFDPLWCRLVR